MSTSTAPTVRNGVPVDKLFGTINKLSDQPELAAFKFTARSEWVEGTANQSTMHEWYGVGTDHLHGEEYKVKADHPTLGNGHGPTPHEFVLHAISSCITAGIATTAAARKIELSKVDIVATGKIDVRGILGISDEVRKGFSEVNLEVNIEGDASPEDLAKVVEGSRDFSAVYDMLANPTPVNFDIKA